MFCCLGVSLTSWNTRMTMKTFITDFFFWGGESQKENYFQKVFSVELCIEYFGKVCHGYIVVWLFSHNRLPLRNIFNINLVNFRKIPWQFASVCPWPTKSYMKILWKSDSQSELWIDANFKLDFSVKVFSP